MLKLYVNFLDSFSKFVSRTYNINDLQKGILQTYMKNYLYLISTICILLISGCAQNNIRPDSNINEEWFEAPYEDLKSSVSRNEATLFVEQF